MKYQNYIYNKRVCIFPYRLKSIRGGAGLYGRGNTYHFETAAVRRPGRALALSEPIPSGWRSVFPCFPPVSCRAEKKKKKTTK